MAYKIFTNFIYQLNTYFMNISQSRPIIITSICIWNDTFVFRCRSIGLRAFFWSCGSHIFIIFIFTSYVISLSWRHCFSDYSIFWLNAIVLPLPRSIFCFSCFEMKLSSLLMIRFVHFYVFWYPRSTASCIVSNVFFLNVG